MTLNQNEDFSVCLWKVNLMCSPRFMFVEPHGGKVVGFGEREIEFKFSLD